MTQTAALNAANNALAKFLEFQKVPDRGGEAQESGKKHAEFIGALHANLVAYFEKVE